MAGATFTQAAARRGRGGPATILTILIGVIFWLLTEIMLMLGKGEYLSPFVAAWTPNLVFFAASLYFVNRTP